MYTQIPAISGKQLIGLLRRDGWEVGRKAKHGITLTKSFRNKTRVIFIPDTRASLPVGTRKAILSDKQTGLGSKGLLRLLNNYGI